MTSVAPGWTALVAAAPGAARERVLRTVAEILGANPWSFADLDGGAVELAVGAGDRDRVEAAVRSLTPRVERRTIPPTWDPTLFPGQVRPGVFELASTVASGRALRRLGDADRHRAMQDVAALGLALEPDAVRRRSWREDHRAWLARCGATTVTGAQPVTAIAPDPVALAAYGSAGTLRALDPGLAGAVLARLTHTQLLRLVHPWWGPAQLSWELAVLDRLP